MSADTFSGQPEARTVRPMAKDAKPLHAHTFRPTRFDWFKLNRAPGTTLWAVEVMRVENGKVVFQRQLDPPDLLEVQQNRIAGFVEWAAREET